MVMDGKQLPLAHLEQNSDRYPQFILENPDAPLPFADRGWKFDGQQVYEHLVESQVPEDIIARTRIIAADDQELGAKIARGDVGIQDSHSTGIYERGSGDILLHTYVTHALEMTKWNGFMAVADIKPDPAHERGLYFDHYLKVLNKVLTHELEHLIVHATEDRDIDGEILSEKVEQRIRQIRQPHLKGLTAGLLATASLCATEALQGDMFAAPSLLGLGGMALAGAVDLGYLSWRTRKMKNSTELVDELYAKYYDELPGELRAREAEEENTRRFFVQTSS